MVDSPIVGRTLIALAVSGLGFASQPALAEDSGAGPGGGEARPATESPGFDALVEEAMGHYNARRYEPALELFERALAIHQEPELVYNIARSHERLLHREQAVDAYERFLEMPGTTGELRTRALSNLTALRQEIAALEAARRAAPVAGAGDQPPDGSLAGAAGEPAGTEPPPATRRIGALGISGYALLGGGAAIAVVGVVFWGLASASNSSFQDAGMSEDRLDLRDDVVTRGLVGDVLFFTGIAALGTGVALVVVDAMRRRARGAAATASRPRATIGVAPALSTGALGLGVAGRF
jgi:hypothetical protein